MVMDSILSLNPQLVILFDKNGDAEKTIFLSYGDINEECYSYSFYKLSKITINFLSDYKILKNHIPLTYNLGELRGFLLNILDVHEPVVVYSPFNNVDCSYTGSTVFNPFVVENETSVVINDDNVILYSVYKKNVTQGLILCVVRTRDILLKSIGRLGYDVENKHKVIEKIIGNIYYNRYVFKSEVHSNNELELDHTLDLSIKMLKINIKNKVQKSLLIDYKGDLYVSGDFRRLYEINKENKLLIFYDAIGNEIFKIHNDIITIYNDLEFDSIRNENTETFNIKNKKKKSTYVVRFETNLDTNLKFDFDFNFFVELKKGTQNIYSDRSGDIQIIISKDHISFRSSVYNDMLLYEYFTAIFLGYNNINNPVKKNRTDIKINQLYTSRYCQNTKNHERKPRIILESSLDMSQYNVINPRYYCGKIINGAKIGDVFISSNGLFYKCFDPVYPYISFVSNFIFFNNDNIPCIPCCFAKDKTGSVAFNKCIFDGVLDDNEENIYIQNYGRIITNQKKSTFLPPKIDNLINKDNVIKYNLQKKVLYADKYSIVKKCDTSINNIKIDSFNDLYTLSMLHNCIVIDKSVIYIHPEVYEKYVYNNIELKVFIIIQKRLHSIKDITVSKDIYKIDDIDDKKIIILVNKFKELFKDKVIREDLSNEMKLMNNGFYYKNKKLEISNNVSFFKLPDITLEPDSTSSIIIKYHENFFENLASDDFDITKKTFVVNTMLDINENNKLNSEKEKKRILEKLRIFY